MPTLIICILSLAARDPNGMGIPLTQIEMTPAETRGTQKS